MAISEQYLIPKAQRDHGMDKVWVHSRACLPQPTPPLLPPFDHCFEMFASVRSPKITQSASPTPASVRYLVMDAPSHLFRAPHHCLLLFLDSVRLLSRVTLCVLFQEDRLGHVEITSEAIGTLARWYAREAGVRNLAKLVDKVGAFVKGLC